METSEGGRCFLIFDNLRDNFSSPENWNSEKRHYKCNLQSTKTCCLELAGWKSEEMISLLAKAHHNLQYHNWNDKLWQREKPQNHPHPHIHPWPVVPTCSVAVAMQPWCGLKRFTLRSFTKRKRNDNDIELLQTWASLVGRRDWHCETRSYPEQHTALMDTQCLYGWMTIAHAVYVFMVIFRKLNSTHSWFEIPSLINLLNLNFDEKSILGA